MNPGETLGIVGPNGAGKTTLPGCLPGCLRPDAGRIEVEGHAPDDLVVRAATGYLPERLVLDRWMTGSDFLHYHHALARLPAATRAGDCAAALERLVPAFLWTLVPILLSVNLLNVHGIAFWFALILTAGAIGQDVSSGVLQIVFTRPVTRATYVTSRRFAAGAAAAMPGIVHVLFAAALVSARGGAPVPMEVVSLACEDVLLAIAGAAVVVVFSSLFNGLADIGAYVVAVIGLEIASQVAEWQDWSAARAIIAQLLHTLKPDLHLGWLAGHGSVYWNEPVTVVSTIALGLGLAILAVNRKELS